MTATNRFFHIAAEGLIVISASLMLLSSCAEPEIGPDDRPDDCSGGCHLGHKEGS